MKRPGVTGEHATGTGEPRPANHAGGMNRPLPPPGATGSQPPTMSTRHTPGSAPPCNPATGRVSAKQRGSNPAGSTGKHTRGDTGEHTRGAIQPTGERVSREHEHAPGEREGANHTTGSRESANHEPRGERTPRRGAGATGENTHHTGSNPANLGARATIEPVEQQPPPARYQHQSLVLPPITYPRDHT